MSQKPKQKTNEQAVYSWNGPEYIRYQKGKLWYVLAFALAVLLFTWALSEHSIPMMLSTLAIVIAYYFYDQKIPKEVRISLSHFGVGVGDELVPFSELKSFYIDYRPPLRSVHFQFKSSFRHDFGILFPAELPPENLRQFLLTQIPEQKTEDRNFLDSILKITRL